MSERLCVGRVTTLDGPLIVQRRNYRATHLGILLEPYDLWRLIGAPMLTSNLFKFELCAGRPHRGHHEPHCRGRVRRLPLTRAGRRAARQLQGAGLFSPMLA